MNITVQQSNQVIERNVPASLVEYLYNLGLISGVSLSGAIHLSGGTYVNYIDPLQRWYPELYITADKIYILFQSPEIERVLVSNGYSSDGVGITQDDAQTLLTSIEPGLFRNNKNITSFDELKYFTKVTTISYEAFKDSSLTEIDLSNINSVSNYAFSGCSDLVKVNISSLEKWCSLYMAATSYSPFSGNANARLYLNGDKITNLVIPGTVEEVKPYVFYGLKGVASVTFQNGVLNIGDQSFNYCSDLNTVNIPSSLIRIKYRAFWGSSNLTKVNIDDLSAWCNITFYGYHTNPLYEAHHLYLNGSEIISLNIPNDVTTIKDYAFESAHGITSINIPSSVTTIGSNSFEDCIGLTSVIIPGTVTGLGNSCFYNCSNLSSVTISEGVTDIGNHAFCNTAITNITIPNSVTTLGHSAFRYCNSLTSITIPGSITKIYGGTREGEGTFALCGNLTSAVFEEGFLRIENGGSDDYSNTSHPYGAFLNCLKLTQVTLPESTTYIGNYTFCNCIALLSLTIKATTPPVLGGNYVFYTNRGGSVNPQIYVPAESVDAYKAASGWSTYADRIQAIPTT